MNLDNIYEEMWLNAIGKFKNNQFEIDQQISNPNDIRRGITLLVRPSEVVKGKINIFLDELKSVEPNLYTYPASDIHITVMSIISCYSGFKLTDVNIDDYVKKIELSLANITSEEILFKGITASPSCIMIKGFLENNQLNELRNQLRYNFGQSDLQSSIDQRYTIQTAHSTVARFQSDIKQPKKLIEILEKYRNYSFGSFKVNTFELVFNDWYQKVEHTQLLKSFGSRSL